MTKLSENAESKRLYYRLPARVKEKFEEYAKADAADIGELPGWVFRRLIFTYNQAIEAGLSIADICKLIDTEIQRLKQKNNNELK